MKMKKENKNKNKKKKRTSKTKTETEKKMGRPSSAALQATHLGSVANERYVGFAIRHPYFPKTFIRSGPGKDLTKWA